MPDPITGIVVAGGKSLRLGQDKRRLRLWGPRGPTLLEHTLAVVRSLCDEVVVVLNDAEAWPELHVLAVADAFPDGGSLGGIATGLMHAQHPYGLVVAADMPLLNASLLRWMIAQPRTYDILAPRPGGDTKSGGWETLCAIYSSACLPVMTSLLQAGTLKIRRVYDQVHVRAVEPEWLQRFDPEGIAFLNVNTDEDRALVERHLAVARTTEAE